MVTPKLILQRADHAPVGVHRSAWHLVGAEAAPSLAGAYYRGQRTAMVELVRRVVPISF